MREAFKIGDFSVAAGQRCLVDLPVAKLSNHTPVTLPVHVLHGRRPGPTLFVSAAIHGDEVLGIEVIRRLLRVKALKSIKGTLLCIPIVNTFGYLSHSRYLPDRRDLNRCFPGSEIGSLASQIANMFMREIVDRSQVGIDLHTGAINRPNLPQVRLDANEPKLLALARSFGAPVILDAPLRPGSLRHCAKENGTDVIVFEAGEALRLDEFGIRVGTRGILHVMRELGMISPGSLRANKTSPALSRESRWDRAPDGGLFRAFKTTGDSVTKGELLGVIANPYEDVEEKVSASISGLIIGRLNLPVVNQGDALFHIARVGQVGEAEERIGVIAQELGDDPLFDEDEII